MLKKIIIIILSISMLMTTVFAGADLSIVIDEITPLPVEPGQDMTIKTRLVNLGDEMANDISVERVYSYPFRLEYDLQEQVDLGSLSPGNSREMTFYISVSSQAKTGVYPLTFKIKEGIKVKDQDVLINVVGIPDIMFDVVKIDKNIAPADTFNVELNLINIGTGNSRKIKITSNDEDFAFKNSNLYYIDGLKSSESKLINLSMVADSSIDSGLYQIPLSIEMIGENGQTYISNQNLNIELIDRAEISLKDLKLKPASVIVGKPVNLEIRIENIGVGEADNVYVELKFDSEGVTGSKKAYVGRLDKNDESPAFFTLNSQVEGKYPGKILIHYTDDLGEHSITESFNVNFKEDTSINWMLYIGIIIGLGVIFLIARSIVKKKLSK